MILLERSHFLRSFCEYRYYIIAASAQAYVNALNRLYAALQREANHVGEKQPPAGTTV